MAGDLEFAHPFVSGALGSGSKKNGAAAQVPLDRVIGKLAAICKSHGLGLLMDVVLDRADRKGSLVLANPDLYAAAARETPDPRSPRAPISTALAHFEQHDLAKRLIALWSERLLRLLKAGLTGFRFLDIGSLAPPYWHLLNGALRSAYPECVSLAFAPGTPWRDLEPLAEARFDGIFCSLPWWDRRSAWFAEELDVLRRIAPIVACPEVPFGPRLASRFTPGANMEAVYRQALTLAASVGDALMVPMGFEHGAQDAMDPKRSASPDTAPDIPAIDLTKDIQAAIKQLSTLADLGTHGDTRALSEPGDAVTAIIRHDAPDARQSRQALIILVNADYGAPQTPALQIDPIAPGAGAPLGGAVCLDGTRDVMAPLTPGSVRLIKLERLPPALQRRRQRQELTSALQASRIAIENITPIVDDGRFAVKRLSGETISVAADIFADGHLVIAAELMWKAAEETDWQRIPMQPGINDRWQSDFAAGRVGRHVFTIEAWIDEFAGLRRDIDIKKRIGADISVEVEEARTLIKTAAANAPEHL
ncbi:MAG TPA: maltotransferase domain-containing protein, partial [Methylovirgula sp.]